MRTVPGVDEEALVGDVWLTVSQELPQDERARLLTQLAAKVFSHAVGI